MKHLLQHKQSQVIGLCILHVFHMPTKCAHLFPLKWLQLPRRQGKMKRAWVPPINLLMAAALLTISCIHYLAKPTGRHLALGCTADDGFQLGMGT